MNFSIGDRIAHPLHGAGVIDRIESRRIDGETRDYYVLKLQGTGMVVMVPMNAGSSIGMRPIADIGTVHDIFRRIPELDTSMTDNWNQRYRENMERIKSGDLLELAGVIKALTERNAKRPLSAGERAMLRQAKKIFLSEVSLAVGCSYEYAERRLEETLRKPN